jgi:hypothetical protein
MKLLITHFSTVSCFVLSLRSKYSQHQLIRHLPLLLSSEDEIQSLILPYILAFYFPLKSDKEAYEITSLSVCPPLITSKQTGRLL